MPLEQYGSLRVLERDTWRSILWACSDAKKIGLSPAALDAAARPSPHCTWT